MNINLPEKLYYGIGEVAKAFGVNTSLILLKKTLSYWAQLIMFMKSGPKNCRMLMLFFYLQYLKKIKII